MGKAKVNISSLSVFNTAVATEKQSAELLKSVTYFALNFQNALNDKITKLESCIQTCSTHIVIVENKLSTLQSRLCAINIQLSKYKIVNSTVTNDASHSNTEENNNFKELTIQAKNCNNKIAKIQQLLASLKKCETDLCNALNTYHNIRDHLSQNLNNIIISCNNIIIKSTKATSLLNKAIKIVTSYVNTIVSINPVRGVHISFTDNNNESFAPDIENETDDALDNKNHDDHT